MGQWKFVNVKEEFAPLLFKHIAGVNNYTIDALNYLKMIEKLSDTIELEDNLIITLSNLY